MELSKAMFLQNMLARSKTFVTGEEGALAKTASQAPSSPVHPSKNLSTSSACFSGSQSAALGLLHQHPLRTG
jgi:hypothetical protein